MKWTIRVCFGKGEKSAHEACYPKLITSSLNLIRSCPLQLDEKCQRTEEIRYCNCGSCSRGSPQKRRDKDRGQRQDRDDNSVHR